MRHPARTRSSFVRVALAGLLGVPVLLAGAVLQPAAAVSGPTGLAPDGTTVSGTPVFSWDPMPTSTSYDVEVYDGATKLTSVSNTVNDKWVPNTVELPTGHELTWRVRGSVSGVDTDWSTATLTRDPVSAPNLVSPVAGVTLSQPGDPLVYRWNAVPGAKTYTVEVGPDPDFVDPNLVTTYTTSATRLAPNAIPKDGHYYWRVTGNLSSGVKSDRSTVEDYFVQAVIRSGGDATVPQLPEYPDNDQTIKDVVLDWHPIDGAATYNLQVSTDSNFLTVVHSVTGLKSTRYSPPTTLDNDQYWWRIQPVNADGVATPWESSPVWRFTRRWDDQASLVYPADGQTVGDPFYFQWSPVPLASRYQIQMSTNESFTPSNTVTTCSTVHTTYTPSLSAGDCWPGAAGTYFWRVISYDEGGGIVSEVVNGQVHSFTYDPDLVTQLAPADNATGIQIPTLSWQPFPNADHYLVTLTPAGGSPSAKTTIGTTMTWPTMLTAGTTYRWQVQPVFDDGRIGASLLLGSQWSFTAADPDPGVASSPTPVSSGPAAVRPPILNWTAVAGATSYTVQVRLAGTVGWTPLSGTFAYPSGSDTTGVKMSPGTYEWQVKANNSLDFSSTSTYTILPFASVGGYKAALNGNASGSPDTSCTATLPSACQNLRQTPLLRWDPVEGAATYTLTIAHDVNLTNVVKVVNVRGTNLWMNPAALPDADAATAYYWDVVPCGPTGVCKTQTPATHQFNKQGVKVHLTSPLGTTAPNDITFTWQDYLATLQADSGSGSSLTTPAATEAMQYRIQVSANADMSSPLDNRVVDQTSYTPYALTYPEQLLYWRVQAIDGTGNALPWSDIATVTKSSPAPTLTDGINGEVFPGSISLGWAPLAYAKTYTVQVFHAGVNPDTATPLLTQVGLKQNSYAPTAPLAPGDYIWRVRRADADARAGQWSSVGTFTSSGSAPTLVSPADGVEVSPKLGLFTWQPSAGSPVSSYRVQLTRAEGSSPAAVTTIATAYAPTTVLADGHWTWTVTALDTGGNAMGASSRQFVVAGTLSPGTVTITGTGQVGDLLTIDPMSWNVTPTSITYQWYRATTAITGATSSTYTVTAADVGHALKVKVTGYKDGYSSGTGTYSNTINAVAGPTQVVLNNPSFTGTRTIGSTLTGDPGTWTTTDSSPGSSTFTFQWLRNGAAISGATAQTYTIVALDAGRAISLRVTATKAGYPNATATSTSGTVAKAVSRTSETLARTKIRRTRHGIVYARVTAPSPIPITGVLRVYDGSKLLKSVTLSASNGGRKTITLPLLKRGRHYIWVKYSGNTQLTSSYSSRLTLRVTR